MELPTIPLLQRQLDTTLQLVISLSSTMTTNEIMMVKMRLTEANIIMGRILVDRDTNGRLIPPCHHYPLSPNRR